MVVEAKLCSPINLTVEVFSLQKVVKMLEEVVVGERLGEYGG